MSDMITTRSKRVTEILNRVETKKKEDEIARNWEILKNKQFARAPAEYVFSRYIGNIQDILPDGAWSGKRCFIIGGGRSLKGFNFSRFNH